MYIGPYKTVEKIVETVKKSCSMCGRSQLFFVVTVVVCVFALMCVRISYMYSFVMVNSFQFHCLPCRTIFVKPDLHSI